VYYGSMDNVKEKKSKQYKNTESYEEFKSKKLLLCKKAYRRGADGIRYSYEEKKVIKSLMIL